VFVKDSLYIIDRDYVIAGTLIIEPGTTVKFYPNGRIIDSTGGRIIADGAAQAFYAANPDGIDPIQPPGSPTNMPGFTGYADMNYFLYQGTGKTVNTTTVYDKTVHTDKHDVMFNVVLDKNARRIVNLTDNEVGTTLAGDRAKVPFEAAIMFYASRLQLDPQNDVALNLYPWKRYGGRSVDVTSGTIFFKGQAVNNFSREWGHIIILPGARAAFFRNCQFENFRKDVTVDDEAIYNPAFGNDADYAALNNEMNRLTNGAGGAISTLSSRTWLLNVVFKNNFARVRGGALNILQAPDGFPRNDELVGSLGYYATDKNPALTDRDGQTSFIPRDYRMAAIDQIDESGETDVLSNSERRAYDDGRLAVYLGRVRNLKFENNTVQLAKVDAVQIGTPPVTVVMDVTDEPAPYPFAWGNHAYGGAIYISGKQGDLGQQTQMEVGFGVNNEIKTVSRGTLRFNDDTFEALGNTANNYQNQGSSFGARGGAVYSAHNTSLQVAGRYEANETFAKFLQDSTAGTNSGYYSRGGGIYLANSYNRLTVRGGPRREIIGNQTVFIKNKSGAGGAIFQDGNPVPYVSPIIGGSDVTPITRDYGLGIKFLENSAIAFGGAVATFRNMSCYGAGGVEQQAEALIGYGGNYTIFFEKNTAGFSGGAIDIRIPSMEDMRPTNQRTVQIARTDFRENTVGFNQADINKEHTRGGGAIYSLNGDLNVMKGVTFLANKVHNGSGGAIAMVNPMTTVERFYVNDIDVVNVDWTTGLVTSYASLDDVFTYKDTTKYPPDARMMTRFLDNEVTVDQDILGRFSGSGTTQIGYGSKSTGNILHSTTFFDQNVGYAVGMFGTIIKVSGGGLNWTYKNYPTPYRLKSVYFTDYNNGVVVGDRALIIRTTDNGNSWTEIMAPTETHSWNSVTFEGSLVGYVVGGAGKINKTTDGGLTWFDPTTGPVTNNTLHGVYFTSISDGYAIGDRGLILKTTDGGQTWDIRNANTFSNLRSVYFVDTQTGFIAGSFGQIFKTTNAGSSWTKVFENSGQDFYSVFFTDLLTGYVVGDNGWVLKTEDGGASWTQKPSNTIFGLKSIFLPTSSDAYACGDYGQIIKSTDAGETWSNVIAANTQIVDVVRYHPEVGTRENGIGLGGALYILDSVTVERDNRTDKIWLNRTRFQNNSAYTGAAVYSDNWNLKIYFNRSLVTGNSAWSDIGVEQNVIWGPVEKDQQGALVANEASSDLASSIIYAEAVGPFPREVGYTDIFAANAANTMYDNDARFLVRLPDAPNTKGVLAGSLSGWGGTDTLRWNYWGKTEANVIVQLQDQYGRPQNADEETFFVETNNNPYPYSQTYMRFIYPATSNPTEQGPFESLSRYTYTVIPFLNGATENEVGTNSLPAKVLMAGLVYDIHDKGTDIKTADYSARRMSPIEDFAVGIPPLVNRFWTMDQPSYGKYVKRWLRNPEIAEARNSDGDLIYPFIAAMQGEFRPDKDGNYYHPVGYPLFLETEIDYEGVAERSNHDVRLLNESVFFVINESTGDFIRTNLRQVDENAPYREVFRSRVELVPDSTNRNPNTIFRRTEEGMFNLGVGSYLLQQLRWEPYKEDRSVLLGRKYSAGTTQFAKVPELFWNRPGMPASNNGNQTFFGGERYTSLPVNVGDEVRVVSRTVLWREGVIEAFDDGISFEIVKSTEGPEWTGNVVTLKTDTLTKVVGSEYPWEYGQKDTIQVTEFLHKIFVTEDREYPQSPGTYSGLPIMEGQGRDSIMTITAKDTNKFYDPRSWHLPMVHPQLLYTWSSEWDSGLRQWLQCDTIPAGDTQHQNPRDLAKGYYMLRGWPTNPYVVPGGEDVYVSASNFPPTAETVDYLKQLNIGQDSIDAYMQLFRKYMNAGVYDIENARYLQQDTINYGSNRRIDYTFKLFVVNQPPVFADWVETKEESDAAADTMRRRINMAGDEDIWVVYTPSIYTCGMTPDDPSTQFSDRKMKANLTDKLRFQADFNTQDEQEDMYANMYGRTWDYRYGKTAYGFVSVTVRPDEEIVIDSTNYDTNNPPDGTDDTVLVRQNRPVWMANKYLKVYGSDDTMDDLGVDFQTYGKLNIRIPAAEAYDLLTPETQYNGDLHLDTLFTVICNDGHGGTTPLTLPIYINVKPTIITNSLPAAKEDYDYNTQLIDSVRMIKVFDPNTDQEHRFELVYSDYPEDSIPKDPCYDEAGYWDLRNLKTTPNWMKINPISGILYGTPYVDDAPKDEMVTVIVWDIIDGEKQLSDVVTLSLRVDSTNHRPDITSAPIVRCVDRGKPYEDTLLVSDYDLKRGQLPGDPSETLTLTVEDKNGNVLNGFTLTPNPITGPRDKDTVPVLIKTDNFDIAPDADGKVTIYVIVTDASGMSDTLKYRLKYSDPVDFICPLLIENTKPGDQPGEVGFAWQILEFGTAPKDATTGDGFDGEDVGTLDYNFCEYDLPPIPPKDVFDARWTIPLTNGTYRNIFPRAKQGVQDVRIYKGRVQAGGEVGNTSIYYPVSISWDKNDIPDKNDAQINPTGSQWFIRDASSNGNLFNYNMKTGEGEPGANSSDYRIITDGDRYRIQIHNPEVDAFIILHDWASGLDEQPLSIEDGIAKVNPNPATTTAMITFGVKDYGKIKLDVIDALGNVVATIADADYAAGMYDVQWNTKAADGQPLASGTYTLRLSTGSSTTTSRLVIVR